MFRILLEIWRLSPDNHSWHIYLYIKQRPSWQYLHHRGLFFTTRGSQNLANLAYFDSIPKSKRLSVANSTDESYKITRHNRCMEGKKCEANHSDFLKRRLNKIPPSLFDYRRQQKYRFKGAPKFVALRPTLWLLWMAKRRARMKNQSTSVNTSWRLVLDPVRSAEETSIVRDRTVVMLHLYLDKPSCLWW